MRSLFFLLFTVVAQVSFSQSKIGKQAENVGKDIEKANTVVGKIDEVGKTIGKIFGKKNKKNKQGDSTVASPVNKDPVIGRDGPATIPSGNSRAGEIAPDAKYLEVNEFGNFNQGAACVRRGLSTALINAKGDLIVPFNTFRISSADNRANFLFSNGIFFVLSPVPGALDSYHGFINPLGKLITKGGDLQGQYFGWDRSSKKDVILIKEYIGNRRHRYTYITAEGKKYQHDEELTSLSEGIGVYNVSEKRGYRTIDGKTIILPTFSTANAFSDGMAVVGQRNEFGETKYGYIDNTGKQVIPCIYSIEPSPFRNGFARIVPKDKTEFEYAFINKAGKIIIKHTQADMKAYLEGFKYFTREGLAFNSRYVMDTTGSIKKVADFLAGYGISNGQLVNYHDDGRLTFIVTTKINPFTRVPCMGSLNLTTGKVVDAAFDFNKTDLYFDPLAKLAYARVCIGKDTHNVHVYREGYINEDGLFVIVKAPGSTY